MTTSTRATVDALHAHLRTGTYTLAPQLLDTAGHLATDDGARGFILRAGHGRELAAARLWLHVADRHHGPRRVQSLTIAAIFALDGGNPGLAATLVTYAEVTARREYLTLPPTLHDLKNTPSVRAHLSPRP